MIASVVILFFTAYLACSIFNIGLYFFIAFFANIVLTIEILSLFKSITPIGIIIINTAIFLLTLSVWIKNKRPVYKPKFKIKKIINALKLDKSLIVLLICFLFLVLVSFLLSVFIPVNEPDAQSYHVLRAFVWAKTGYIHHFITSDVRNSVMPINSELIYAWIIAFTKNDTGFGLLQFFAWIFSLFSLTGILKEFKFSLRQILWTCFVFSSLAGIIAQISSTQTDLLTGAFLLSSLYLFIKYNKTNKCHLAYFSSLAMALSMGIKSTGVMASVPVLLIMLYITRKNIKKIFAYVGFLVLNFLIFSSYNYILNFISYGNFLGSKASFLEHAFEGTFTTIIANFIRYIFQMFDFSGFTIGYFLSKPILGVQQAIFDIFNLNSSVGVHSEMTEINSFLTEQTMGYGVLGFLVFLPYIFISLFKKSCPKILKLLSLAFILNLIILSAALSYMVFSIRFFTAYIVISAPVLVLSYRKKMTFYKVIVILFCMFYMLLVSTNLAQRPFYKLYNSFKKESSYNAFKENVRCLNYPYFKSETNGCTINKQINTYYTGKKNIAVFLNGDSVVLPLFMDKERNVDFLLVNKINEYEIKKYDLLVINSPFQKINNFNVNEPYYPSCTYTNRLGETLKGDAASHYTNAAMAYCITPKTYLEKQGFKLHSYFREKDNNSVNFLTFWVKDK